MSKIHKSLLIVTLFVLAGLAGCTSNNETVDDSANDYYDENRELQQQIADLRVNNTLLEAEKSALEEENNRLQGQIDQLTIDYNDAIVQLNNLSQTRDDFVQELEDCEENNSDLEDQIIQLNYQISNIDTTVDQLNNALNENISEQQNLLSQIDNLNNLINDYQVQLADATSQLSELSNRTSTQLSLLHHTPNIQQIGSCPESNPPTTIFQTGFDDGSGGAIANDGILELSEIIEELYECDMSDSDEIIVKNINLNGDSEPMEFTVLQNKVLFSADDGIHGRELWISDGTLDGTQMVKNINTGNGDSYPGNFTILDGLLYFTAFTQSLGTELWVTDGSEEGTVLVHDIWQGISSGYVGYLTTIGDKLYFAGNDGLNGNEPWISNGTTSGTNMIKDINSDFDTQNNIGNGSISSGSKANIFYQYDGMVYFTAYTSANGAEPWITDGTKENTNIFVDVYPGIESSQSLIHYSGQFLGTQTHLFYSANDSLWSYNSVSGSVEIDDGNYFDYFTMHQNGFYYMKNGLEMKKSDGTIAGTTTIYTATTTYSCWNYYSDTTPGAYMNDLVSTGNHLLFGSHKLISGSIQSYSQPWYELFISDGTTQNTDLMSDLYIPGNVGSSSSNYQCSRRSSYPHNFNVFAEGWVSFDVKNSYGSLEATYVTNGIDYLTSFDRIEMEFVKLGNTIFYSENGELNFDYLS